MQSSINYSVSKKSANLSINSELLAKAKNLKINLSATLEQALANKVKTVERENWLKKNQKALDTLNNFSEKNGLFSDSYRPF